MAGKAECEPTVLFSISETDYRIGQQRILPKSRRSNQRDTRLQYTSRSTSREKCPENARFRASSLYQSDNNDFGGRGIRTPGTVSRTAVFKKRAALPLLLGFNDLASA